MNTVFRSILIIVIFATLTYIVLQPCKKYVDSEALISICFVLGLVFTFLADILEKISNLGEK